ncbi:MAG TPA: chloride channel protein [Myxococcota bacterium]|nr:chloride channel protein [Myxococcota bacterium]
MENNASREDLALEDNTGFTDGDQLVPERVRVDSGARVGAWLSRALGGPSVFLLVLAAIVGVAGGYGAILFRYLIRLVNHLAFPGGIGLDRLAALPWYWLVLPPALGGLLVGPLIYFFAREAKGHGVPEVMEACTGRGGRIRPRVALVKIMASAVSIGSGGSVGREGPIVQIGSTVGSSVGQLFGFHSERMKILVATGTAAGIAATFNAPIAGVLFAVEIILGRGTVKTFSPLVVGAVVATVIARYHLGNFPAFQVAPYDLVSAWELPLYVLLGALAAVAGVAFTKGLYAVEDIFTAIPIPEYLKAILGGALVGIIAIWLPHVMGVGYEQIERVLTWQKSQFPLDMSFLGFLLLLGGAKIIATGMTIGSGGSGGIFAPSLFIGASLGGAFGILANWLLPAGLVASPSAYALVAMGALVAATTHAPLTAILIVFELTNQHTIILPLMLACILSHFIATKLSSESIYTLKLVRRGARFTAGAEAEIMSGTSVSALTHKPGRTLRPDTALDDIIERVLSGEHHQQYVTDKHGRLLGVVTVDTVTNIIRDEKTLRHLLVAADLMQPTAECASPDDTLDSCISMFSHHHVDELPVTDTHQRLIGWISQADAIALYNREVLRRDAVVRFSDGGAPSERQEERVNLTSGEVKSEIPVSGMLLGKSLKQLDLRARFGVVVYAVRHRRQGTRFPDPAVPLGRGDTLVVVGPEEKVAKLRAQAQKTNGFKYPEKS